MPGPSRRADAQRAHLLGDLARRTRRRPAPRRRRARSRCRSGRRSASSSRRRCWRRARGRRRRARSSGPCRRAPASTGSAAARRASATLRPVRVEPVNMIMSTCSISAAPVVAAAGGDLEDAVGQPALAQPLGEQQRGQRRDLGGLEDHAVAGRERRDAVAEGVGQRVVPGADHADQAERAVAQDQLLALDAAASATCTRSSAR